LVEPLLAEPLLVELFLAGLRLELFVLFSRLAVRPPLLLLLVFLWAMVGPTYTYIKPYREAVRVSNFLQMAEIDKQ
jgi:hypothetical protein